MHKFKILSITLSLVLLLVIGIYVLQPEPSIVENIPIVEYAEDPVPDFSEYSQVNEKKRAFFEYLKPAIESQNEYIKSIRHLVQGFQAKELAGERLSKSQQKELDWLINEYRVEASQTPEKIYAELLRKIDIIPPTLVLMQTANESAWGTSRFARNGYNFFGLWCFEKGCGFVPSRRNDDAAHEVAKFDDLSSAMYAYMRNLNSHPAYKDLRIIREKSRDKQQPITAYGLAEGLTRYSERGEEYVDELRQMMRFNKDLID